MGLRRRAPKKASPHDPPIVIDEARSLESIEDCLKDVVDVGDFLVGSIDVHVDPKVLAVWL